MSGRLCIVAVLLLYGGRVWAAGSAFSGAMLPSSTPEVGLWWAPSSAAKIRPGQAPPGATSPAVYMRCAQNEWEDAQVVVRPVRALENVRARCSSLEGPGGSAIASERIEILQARYLSITQATDRSSATGLWPDPLLPVRGPVRLEGGTNHAFWLRLHVPRETAAGVYRGHFSLTGEGVNVDAPVELTVYDFALPDRMTCVSAFGFSPGEVFRYHGLKTEADKRVVLEKYWADLSAHHVSPYDPAPLDPIKVRWPEVRPPKTQWDDWSGLNIVTNERHGGGGALLVHDDKTNENVSTTYEPLIRIPPKGLRVRFWYRTPVAGHSFMITLTHFDAKRQWMSGRNNDIVLRGNGQWQSYDQMLASYPKGAEYVRFIVRATRWTEPGEALGLVWVDDISIRDAESGEEFIRGGDFERKPRTELVVPAEQLRARFDFAAWDRAMERAMDEYHFTSFQVSIPGMGSGSFYSVGEPNLLGFGENEPEYPLLFNSYGRQMEEHLKGKGWVDRAFIYWFDEPEEHQYPFVMNGFSKLKRACPGIARMLTEQVEPGLIGGPNIWCPITDSYNHERAEERRAQGDRFWWYVCTGPKAPYAGLFIDHPAPEMRIWLWQTFQRRVEGILVWQINYWTSEAAYPEARHPQNPFADPMSWTSGYGTKSGERLPWGNGDGRFLYPPAAAAEGRPGAPVLDGPVDSIRWEQLRDGIEDYEYLCILRHRLEGRAGGLSATRRAQLAGLLEVPASITSGLTEFTREGGPIEEQRDRIARAIESLR